MTPAGTFLGGGTPLLLYISTISTFHSIHSHCPQETGEAAAAVGNVVDRGSYVAVDLVYLCHREYTAQIISTHSISTNISKTTELDI